MLHSPTLRSLPVAASPHNLSALLATLPARRYIARITVATGAAMSAGLLIFIAGHRRYIFEHTQLLIHSGSAAFTGTAEQIESAQRAYHKQINDMKEYILSHTQITPDLYKKNKSKDWYVSGSRVIDLGIADKIVNKFSDIV